jgi:hypothetical protein
MVSFADNEIIVGLAAKQGRVRNITNTIRQASGWGIFS